MKNGNLAKLVSEKAVRKEIEEKVKSRYVKRIEHLVGANNELIKELERRDKERKGNIFIPHSVADRILLEENL